MEKTIKQMQGGWYVQIKYLPREVEDGFFYWGESEKDNSYSKQWINVVEDRPEYFSLCFTLESAKNLSKIIKDYREKV